MSVTLFMSNFINSNMSMTRFSRNYHSFVFHSEVFVVSLFPAQKNKMRNILMKKIANEEGMVYQAYGEKLVSPSK